jgi:transcriptional regulator GlxA family with amidase domain
MRKLFEHAGAGGCATYIKLQRIERARRMLTSPLHLDKKIIDIAFLCGFDDISTFNRGFRAAFGASPSDLRQPAFDAVRSSDRSSDRS